jgi:hypothetical protein
MNEINCPFNKPKYEPMFWDNLKVDDKKITNCYSYAFNYVDKNYDPENTHKLQPGEQSNTNINNLTCANIINNIEEDFGYKLRSVSLEEQLPCNHYRIAIVLDNIGDHRDYHFYRQDMPSPEGYLWSHKQGKGDIKRIDALGKYINDPKTASRNYSKKSDKSNDKYNYEVFCGYFSVPYNGGPFYR